MSEKIDMVEPTRAIAVATFLTLAALYPGAAAAQGPGKPANLCRELVAFVQQPDAAKTDGPSQPLATSVQAPKQDGAEAKPSEAGGEPQKNSGQSGQIAASGPGASGAQGATQNAAAPSGAASGSAPAQPGSQAGQGPPAAPTVARPTPEALEQVEAAARANDLRGCRAAAQRMRRAGVPMPGPLVALAAMDPRFLESALEP